MKVLTLDKSGKNGKDNHVFKNNYGVKDLYKDYVETVKRRRNEQEPLLKAVYGNIIKDINQTIMDKVILESKEIVFPWYMGSLRIKKKKTISSYHNNRRYIPKDWKKSKEAGSWVLEFNEHRDGNKYLFSWTKSGIEEMRFYRFFPSRSNKRKLAKILKTDMSIDYFI